MLAPILAKYKAAQDGKQILYVSFTSVVDYMWLLRAGCECLAAFEKRSVLYLAAAVSDFYIPSDKMVGIDTLFSVLKSISSELLFFLRVAHTQNAIGPRCTDNFTAIGAENVGTVGQFVGAACVCRFVQIGDGRQFVDSQITGQFEQIQTQIGDCEYVTDTKESRNICDANVVVRSALDPRTGFKWPGNRGTNCGRCGKCSVVVVVGHYVNVFGL